jgi:four helix bundle protein
VPEGRLRNPRGRVLEQTHEMASRIISVRTFEFACRIVRLCAVVRSRGFAGRKISDQLFDCGNSIGANSEEAEGGQTKPDFVARLAISRKESHETIDWLRVAIATGVVTKEEVSWELDEAFQLRAMITKAIKTAQSSSSRSGADHDPSNHSH